MCIYRRAHIESVVNMCRHSHMTTASFSSISCLEMGVMLCLSERSSTILSHIGLTSNTSDKPILFPSTESSPCPKITLLSLGSQQRRMVSRGVDSSLWHLQYARKRQIKPFCKSWFPVISKIYRARVACHLVLYVFYLSLLERHGYLRVLPGECWKLETLSPCSVQPSQRMSHIIAFFTGRD